MAKATRIAAELAGMDIKGAAVSIHGFGNVGTFAFRYLTEIGAKIVAIADKSGAVYDANGLNAKRVGDIIDSRKQVSAYGKAALISQEDFWKIPVDILIPASITDVINETNKNGIKANIIVEAANIPMQESVEREFWQKGIMIVPDFVANAGGVISSYAEYRGYNPKKMFELVERKITQATMLVMGRSLKTKKNPREVGLAIAKEIVRNA
ncbi:MAG: hypothetical protein HYS76_02050 [Candidatus Wildermuthbacteria bacterium]|nr:hypothetical protein [Candidatus Wildermuthbacteria bacterium]